MKHSYDYDLAVLGGGTAGLAAARWGDTLGAKVVLIEAGKLGGDWVWGSSVTSKTLLQSARVHELVTRSEEFGIHVEKSRVVWAAVRLRLADVRDQLRARQREDLGGTRIEVIKGRAAFHDPHLLEIETENGARMLSAKAVVIATGSRPVVPEMEGLSESGYLLPEALLDRPSLPRSLVIVGGGSWAAELGQAFHRLGTTVNLVSTSGQLLPDEEKDVSATVERVLGNEGLVLHLGAKILRAGAGDSKKWVEIEGADGPVRLEGSELVVVAEHAPNLGSLNLAAAGIDTDADGMRVTDRMQTSVGHIFACGDAAGRDYSGQNADFEARIAAANALQSGRSSVNGQYLPAATHTDPEVARLGLTLERAKAELGTVKVFEVPFSQLDRAIMLGETTGFARVITSRSGRVLGVHIVGPSASEIISAFVPAVRDGALLQEFAEAVYPSLTLSSIAHQLGTLIYREMLGSKALRPGSTWAGG